MNEHSCCMRQGCFYCRFVRTNRCPIFHNRSCKPGGASKTGFRSGMTYRQSDFCNSILSNCKMIRTTRYDSLPTTSSLTNFSPQQRFSEIEGAAVLNGISMLLMLNVGKFYTKRSVNKRSISPAKLVGRRNESVGSKPPADKTGQR